MIKKLAKMNIFDRIAVCMSGIRSFFVGKMMDCRGLIEKLDMEKALKPAEWVTLLSSYTGSDRLFAA